MAGIWRSLLTLALLAAAGGAASALPAAAQSPKASQSESPPRQTPPRRATPDQATPAQPDRATSPEESPLPSAADIARMPEAELDRLIARAQALGVARRFAEAEPVFEAIRDAAQARGLDAQRAWALVGLGHVRQGTRRDGAEALGREALAIFEARRDARGISHSSYLLSLISPARDPAATLALARRSLAASDEAGDAAGRARARLRII
jgi:hypothetical protein